jgi:hypothetical protein
MFRMLITFLFALTSLVVVAQTPVDVGGEGMQTPVTEKNTGADLWATQFDENNVGFLHVYVDPALDPLETYLFKGQELSQAAIDMMPARLRTQANAEGTEVYATMAIKGISENLYLTRMAGKEGQQIDMFAIRDGRIRHLKTLALRKCSGGTCEQLDSYITDLDLDTRFDLVQIARQTTGNNDTMNERRTIYYMPTDTRRWRRTEELEVPWEGITFFEPGQDEN